ncbi:pectate lyase-like adhesive domain-containing protein [Enterococcus sp. AZ177]|uniref:pectate lyase-like adhesive domain-containing protein n=1 Tax=unclassified Enterococcus TaxID=2608891 RepID=UPI003D2FCCAF
MKIGKKSYFIGLVIFLFSILAVILLNNSNKIEAAEEPLIGNVDSSTLLKTEEDLHNQETITVPQMEAYMDGTNYQPAQTKIENKITGSMTNEQYQTQYADLNAQQNQAWNTQYNFRPDTNAVHVGTWAEFRAAFENNQVSKIILDADIYYGTAIAISRAESIEIDGQGHLLEMRNGSINVDDLNSLASFGKAFSDVPVFHMHDIQIANNTGYGALEGNLGTAWSFVNGKGQWGTGGSTGSNRRLWRYRIGNVYTPYDTSKKSDNQRVGGRLISAPRAEISMYGYNVIVTGAENFYTGGMTFEPSTFYKGTNAEYDYSVVWFMDNTGKNGDTDSTGTRKFDIGEGSFVYLNYTANGTNYPAVYNFFDELRVGKNATYNANMPGSAAYFNVDGASFIAEEGSTVNLLSRAGSRATVQSGAVNATNAGSQANPKNTKYEFKPKSNVFIVGNNNGGVLAYNSTNGGNQFIFDSPESFDIRNSFNSTTTTNAFLGDTTSNRGTNSFTIKNSDISIWNNQADIDGAPTYDYSNVTDFTVTNASANGGVTSSDPALQSQYLRPNYKRISGMNSIPELTWTPVTDADFDQQSRILIGYTAVGGSDPFDEDGNAKTKPVYADSIRKAYVDFTDTLGNTYTGTSTDDNYVHWKKADHEIPGFQLAQKDMFGTPYRASYVNNVLTPYRMGEKTPTTVIDVTPPEPAIVTGDKVTNGMKQLIGKNAEPKAKIYVDINGTRQTNVGSVNDDGTWAYNLPRYLNTGETVQIFLEDNAGKITETLDPAAPSTNSANGNINPATEMNYRDATFKPATKYSVEDGLPDNPLMEKTVVSSGDKTTQVGDILTYTLTATNGKNASLDAVWNKVTVKDTIPDGLKFDPETADVTINGKVAAETDFTYDVDSHLLTVNVGNLKAGASAVVTFKTEVQQSAVGKVINNVGIATGFSPRESGEFIEGPDDPSRAHDVFSKEANVDNPGGSIFGILELVSAPKNINFGATTFSPKGTKINNPSYEGEDLVVKDGRAVQETWTLNVRLEKELAKVDEPDVFIPRAIRYVHKNDEITLMGASQPIISRKNDNNDPYNISSTWSPDGDGFKLNVDSGQSIASGKYEATIVWELVAGPPSENP